MVERIRQTDQHRWGLIGPSHVELLLQAPDLLADWSPRWTWMWGIGAAGWCYRPFIQAIIDACEACRHVLLVVPHWRHANFLWQEVRDAMERLPTYEVCWDYDIPVDPALNMRRELIANDMAEYILSRNMLDKLDWLLSTYANLSICCWSIYGLEKRTRRHDRIVSYEQLVRRYGERMVSLRNLHLRYDIMSLYADADFHPSPFGYVRMRAVFERYMNELEELGLVDAPP
ncbi:MAG: hypothetical protein EA402_04825 [Planctomycetota bacterium]|nr:MAG: hypothetical protein EA402_04825 [Planctomycetota bacterium]